MPNGDTSGGSRLRFAILCDGETVEQWQLRSIDKLERSGAAECVAIVLTEGVSPTPQPGERRSNRNFLCNLYVRKVSHRCQAKSPASTTAGRPDVPVLRVETEPEPGGRTAVGPEGLAELAALDLDFAVRFGSGILAGEVLRTPRHGVWSYSHGEPARGTGAPPGIWEIYCRSPVTTVTIRRLADPPGGEEILAFATLATATGSYARQLDRLLDETTSLLVNAARRCALHAETPKLVVRGIEPSPSSLTNGEMLKLAWTMASARTRAVLRSFFRHQHWALVVANGTLETVLKNGMDVPLTRYLDGAAEVPEERGMFAADPFVVARPGAAEADIEIVFERFDWRSGIGHIASTRRDGAGRFSSPSTVLELDTHLSYPYVSRRDGRPTILPEACEGGRLIEYALEPHGTPARPIRDHGPAVLDPTTLFHQGRYWMFYCSDAGNSRLCIRHADSPDGPWTEHALNPVKIDVGNARPAGPVLECNGELYRPAQVCAPRYGQGIVFNRIVRLDERSFVEEAVASIVPSRTGRYRHGVHTIASGNGVLVFDQARTTFSFHEAIRELRRKVRKLLGE